ncbi:hypothetical protein MNBD_PLANCTO02-2712 [hydrothermal vent metagenome]|uniref:Uncharacterized protein n=1 Tax=hydrothermal vent metagenome TaxID=652676 RepID=A0A3B1DBJ7_9ZZZZ
MFIGGIGIGILKNHYAVILLPKNIRSGIDHLYHHSRDRVRCVRTVIALACSVFYRNQLRVVDLLVDRTF